METVKTTSEGAHVNVSWSVRIGKMIFDYSEMVQRHRLNSHNSPVLIEVPKDERSVDIEITSPDQGGLTVTLMSDDA